MDDYFNIHIFKRDGLWQAIPADYPVSHTGRGVTPLEAANDLIDYLAKEHEYLFGDLEFVSEPCEEGSNAIRVPMPRLRRTFIPPSLN